jgi:hypothetical protein
VALDVTDGHAARVERDDLLVEAREPPLPLLHQDRLEAAITVARHLDVDVADLGLCRHRVLTPHLMGARESAPPAE